MFGEVWKRETGTYHKYIVNTMYLTYLQLSWGQVLLSTKRVQAKIKRTLDLEDKSWDKLICTSS